MAHAGVRCQHHAHARARPRARIGRDPPRRRSGSARRSRRGRRSGRGAGRGSRSPGTIAAGSRRAPRAPRASAAADESRGYALTIGPPARAPRVPLQQRLPGRRPSPGCGSQSSSTNASSSPRRGRGAAVAGAGRAGARGLDRRGRAGRGAPPLATAAGSGSAPSTETTTCSPPATGCWAASAARQRCRASIRPQAGTTTLIPGPAAIMVAVVSRAGWCRSRWGSWAAAAWPSAGGSRR